MHVVPGVYSKCELQVCIPSVSCRCGLQVWVDVWVAGMSYTCVSRRVRYRCASRCERHAMGQRHHFTSGNSEIKKPSVGADFPVARLPFLHPQVRRPVSAFAGESGPDRVRVRPGRCSVELVWAPSPSPSFPEVQKEPRAPKSRLQGSTPTAKGRRVHRGEKANIEEQPRAPGPEPLQGMRCFHGLHGPRTRDGGSHLTGQPGVGAQVTCRPESR